MTAIVHEGKYSAMWRGTDAESIRLSIPKDITPYTELHFWVHAAENCMVYLMFSSENTATDGSDYYGDQADASAGWQEVSVDIGKLTVSRTPRGYDDIDYLRISATGWSMTNDLSKFELHFDTITLKTTRPIQNYRRAARRQAKAERRPDRSGGGCCILQPRL